MPGFVNGHNSPLEERWGGWYVTGTHAGASHLGNTFVTVAAHRQNPTADIQTPGVGTNVTDLRGRFDTKRYLSRHSDLVALMVLEHELRMHNLITRANYETRLALDQEMAHLTQLNELNELNELTGLKGLTELTGVTEVVGSGPVSDGGLSDWTQQRIAIAGEMLLEYLLFRNEAVLKGPVKGTSAFAREFQRGGPRDSKGRSLRQLDLKTRLFRYPCSFLIYSAAFDALPQEMKNYVWRRLEEILSGRDRSDTYANMAAEDRQAVLEILYDTKPEFRQWLRDNVKAHVPEEESH